MNLKQFKYVLVLAEEKNFSRAANVLSISQPSLSQYVKNIENEIGVQLFERSNGFVQLTDAGKVYIEVGKKVLALEHQMQNKFEDLATYNSGSISIGISPHRAFHLMPEVIAKFKKQYPNIFVVLDEKSGPDLLDCAEHGEFDLFVTTLPINEKIYNYEKMLEEEIVLAVPASFPKLSDKKVADRKFPVIDLSSVNNGNFITMREHMPMKNIEEEIKYKYNLTFNYIAECTSLEAMIKLVQSGVGMALIPITLSRDSTNVAYYSLKQELPLRQIVVAWRKDHYLSKPILAMKELMVKNG